MCAHTYLNTALAAWLGSTLISMLLEHLESHDSDQAKESSKPQNLSSHRIHKTTNTWHTVFQSKRAHCHGKLLISIISIYLDIYLPIHLSLHSFIASWPPKNNSCVIVTFHLGFIFRTGPLGVIFDCRKMQKILGRMRPSVSVEVCRQLWILFHMVCHVVSESWELAQR